MTEAMTRSVLVLLVLVSVLSLTKGCGRKDQPTDTCSPTTIWDATYQSCHGGLLMKRDVNDIVNQDKDNNNNLLDIIREPGRVKRVDLPRYVYRVLRSDEDPDQGISARLPDASYNPSFHVCRGSTYATQYISTTDDEQVAVTYASLSNNRIVRINLRVAMNAGVQVLDIRDGGDFAFPLARNFARSSRELLLYGGTIPRNAMNIVFHPNCS